MDVLWFIAGLVFLVGGAELMVRGAARLAAAFGISPLVVGLTVVAFGTSAPELAVTVKSAYAGQADLALGNVVGSNIANILLILGAASLITPLTVATQLVRFDVWIMIITSLAVGALGFNGQIGRFEGLLLALCLAIYIVHGVWKSRRESAKAIAEYEAEFGPKEPLSTRTVGRNVVYVIVGLVLLVAGAGWLVDTAVAFARAWGVSELVIGLTIVAIGTSLPEVATSIVASLKGERDIAVGNAVGSNIFNVLAVLGIGAAVSPAGIPVPVNALQFDIPVMCAVAIACLPIFFNGYRISRWEGALFLAYYAAYLAFLILSALQAAMLSPFRTAMVWFAIPLTVITLSVITYRTIRKPAAEIG